MAEAMTITAIAPLAVMMSITGMGTARAGAMPTGAPARSPEGAAPAWLHAPVADRAVAVCLARPVRVVVVDVPAVGGTALEAVAVQVGAVMVAPEVVENPVVRATETGLSLIRRMEEGAVIQPPFFYHQLTVRVRTGS
ncbi:hypothetical protein AD928_05225 [Acetobacter cerevisiae]|uniref:Uncharacterized protein n=1 Tax=Acetobacter cerevisiae TaxID=178900 RepID=A0A149QF47_9PROT|nr:hypothetical protein AD928_05225 [Acetobacter cerevisiae]